VRSLAFSPDGKTLTSGGEHNTIKLWHVATGKIISTLTLVGADGDPEQVTTAAFSADGKTLATGSFDHTIKLWDLKTVKKADK
jgi:WD40 repeat protein